MTGRILSHATRIENHRKHARPLIEYTLPKNYAYDAMDVVWYIQYAELPKSAGQQGCKATEVEMPLGPVLGFPANTALECSILRQDTSSQQHVRTDQRYILPILQDLLADICTLRQPLNYLTLEGFGSDHLSYSNPTLTRQAIQTLPQCQRQ